MLATNTLRCNAIALGVLVLLGVAGIPAAASPQPEALTEHEVPRVPILCYHDIRDDLQGDLDEDRYAISTRALVEQFDWLLAHGFEPIGVDRLLAAAAGHEALPERPIVLTFDDGYRSFYDIVFPLLRQYRFPAVLSVVGSWLNVEPGGVVPYADTGLPRERFVSWQQLAELVESPWVEVASHSHALHQGVLANAAGNEQPAAVTPRFDPQSSSIETSRAHQGRIREDLRRSADLIEEKTGFRPRLLAWPYGESTGWGNALARDLGFEATLLLGNHVAALDGNRAWQRILIYGNPSLGDWVWQLRQPALPSPPRGMRVWLRDVGLGGHPEDVEQRLGELVRHSFELQPRDIFLSADWATEWSQAEHDSVLNRIVWQLRTRAQVRAWGWLSGPLSALDERRLEDLARALPLAGWAVDVEPTTGFESVRRLADLQRRHRHDGRLAVALAVDELDDLADRRVVQLLNGWKAVAELVILVEGETTLSPEHVERWELDSTRVLPLLRNTTPRRGAGGHAFPDFERCRALRVAGLLSAIADLSWWDLSERDWSAIRPLLSTADFPYRRP